MITTIQKHQTGYGYLVRAYILGTQFNNHVENDDQLRKWIRTMEANHFITKIKGWLINRERAFKETNTLTAERIKLIKQLRYNIAEVERLPWMNKFRFISFHGESIMKLMPTKLNSRMRKELGQIQRHVTLMLKLS